MPLTKLRQLLAVGVEYTATNTLALRKEMLTPFRRRVVKQTPKGMVSVFLEGPKIGQTIHLDWTGVRAVKHGDGKIDLSDDGRVFLQIESIH